MNISRILATVIVWFSPSEGIFSPYDRRSLLFPESIYSVHVTAILFFFFIFTSLKLAFHWHPRFSRTPPAVVAYVVGLYGLLFGRIKDDIRKAGQRAENSNCVISDRKS